MNPETFSPVLNSNGRYEVSDRGRLRAVARIDSAGALRKQRFLKLHPTEDGYMRFMLCIYTKHRLYLCHRIVFEAFHGPIPSGMEINHKNGVRSDNRLSNLEVLSHAENVRYSKEKLGTDFATYGNGRMTISQIKEIRSLAAKGFSQREIGHQMGFSKSMIGNLIRGECWTHTD